jgi:hypothetical protein
MSTALFIGGRPVADRVTLSAQWHPLARTAGRTLMWSSVVLGLISLVIGLRVLLFWH